MYSCWFFAARCEEADTRMKIHSLVDCVLNRLKMVKKSKSQHLGLGIQKKENGSRRNISKPATPYTAVQTKKGFRRVPAGSGGCSGTEKEIAKKAWQSTVPVWNASSLPKARTHDGRHGGWSHMDDDRRLDAEEWKEEAERSWRRSSWACCTRSSVRTVHFGHRAPSRPTLSGPGGRGSWTDL